MFLGDWACPDTGVIVVISSPVIETLTSYIQSGDREEAGGMLLGYRRGDHLEVTHATEPTKYDIRKIFSFKRNSNTHTEIANKAWSDSKGHICYIGEWHTHPEDNPTPSGVDIREWKKLSMNMEGNNSLFMLIVGRKSIWTGISSSKGILKVLVEVH